MSAPESGRVATMACPLSDDMWISTVGAGSEVEDGGSFVEAISSRVETARVAGELGFGAVNDGDCRPRHTREKWPTFLQV